MKIIERPHYIGNGDWISVQCECGAAPFLVAPGENGKEHMIKCRQCPAVCRKEDLIDVSEEGKKIDHFIENVRKVWVPDDSRGEQK